MNLEKFDRDEFLRERWDYKRGEHVTIVGPTGAGKTMLVYQLLERTASPKLPAVVLAPKPRDATVEQWNKRLKYRKVRDWPVGKSVWNWNPPGYTVWPQHTFDPDLDEYRHHDVFRRAILHSYRRGNRILVVDEVEGMTSDLKLEKPIRTILRQGRSMGTGIWSASQRPYDIPLLCYSAANHLFLAYDSDKRTRDRFREIGGVDSAEVDHQVMQLGQYEWLYIRRRGRRMCILSA